MTKPFYGGKRNRISCQITQPGDKKPFVVINGEWSGSMEAKWADGVNIKDSYKKYRSFILSHFVL